VPRCRVTSHGSVINFLLIAPLIHRLHHCQELTHARTWSVHIKTESPHHGHLNHHSNERNDIQHKKPSSRTHRLATIHNVTYDDRRQTDATL